MTYQHGVETFRFTCHHCQYTWAADYQVRYATDCEGSPWTVYYRNGATTENPAADVITCGRCHHTTVHAHLAARHEVPAAEPGNAAPLESG